MQANPTAGALLAILAPLLGVPLTVIIFYLRSLRDQQQQQLAEMGRRADVLDETVRRATNRLGEIERDYTNKEEWLREAMWSRDRIEKMSTSLAALQADHDGIETLLATSQRSARMIRRIHNRLAGPPAAKSAGATDVPIEPATGSSESDAQESR